jgi:hypothetical protein
MQLCYIDESGCTGVLPTAFSPIQPLLVVGGLFLGSYELRSLTNAYLDLKGRYFPFLMPAGRPFLDRVLVEVKGADLRRDIRSGVRRELRRAIGFLDDLVDLLEQHHTRIVGRAWIKGIGMPINGTSLYTSSIQAICRDFQDFLTGLNDYGVVIADGRSKAKNINVAHSVFTKKYQAAGDEYNRLAEMPTFGNSDNHVALQIADLLCSALLFPLAAYSYCLNLVNNIHVHPAYSVLKQRYGPRLLSLQHRYQDQGGRMRGGVTVSDPIQKRPSILLFR